ncbi:MAG: hypothetical protein OEZ52_16225, partial [Candidatus Aminicenantes bacterium]|nr:hypothetical protein [Candidatus Aminicenantes bacterium]
YWEDTTAPFLADVYPGPAPWEAANIGDHFYLPRSDYRGMDYNFAKNRLDPDSESPINNELTFGIWQEVFRNFSVGANFIYKWKKNIIEDVRYAPDTDEYWYHPDQAAAKKYYIPYSTTVPGTDDYPDRDVTFYVDSNDSPMFPSWRGNTGPLSSSSTSACLTAGRSPVQSSTAKPTATSAAGTTRAGVGQVQVTILTNSLTRPADRI